MTNILDKINYRIDHIKIHTNNEPFYDSFAYMKLLKQKAQGRSPKQQYT